MGAYFRPLLAENITDEHQKYLRIAAQTLQNGTDLADIYLEASRGLINLWEWGNNVDAFGVLATKRFSEKIGDTVFIVSLAGRGLTKVAPCVFSGLKAYRDSVQARFISYRVLRPGTERMMQKFTGAVEVAREYTLDLPN